MRSGWRTRNRWADHRHAPWAHVARRDHLGEHQPYLRFKRPYWGAYDQIEVNSKDWLNFMVIDVDGGGAVDRALACHSPPSWVVPTPRGAHAGWVIDSVKRDRIKAVRYYNAVRENLRRALDGDPGYTQYGTRNPLYRCHATIWGSLTSKAGPAPRRTFRRLVLRHRQFRGRGHGRRAQQPDQPCSLAVDDRPPEAQRQGPRSHR